MEKIPEFEVTMTVRNNRLKKRRTELGFSQRDMAELCGVSVGVWGGYELMKLDPVSENYCEGRSREKPWKESAQSIANFLCVEPEELWPEVVRRVISSSVSKEVSSEEMLVLAGGSCQMALPPHVVTEKSDLKEAVDEVLSTLSPREAEILKKRFGLDGEEEMALAEIGSSGINVDNVAPGELFESKSYFEVSEFVSGEQVRRLEYKALRRLRHPSQSRKLRPFLKDP